MSAVDTELVEIPLSFSKIMAGGVEVSPERISRADFLKFFEDALKFVYGNDANTLQRIPSIENGSLRLVFALPAVFAQALIADLNALNAGDENAVSTQTRIDIAREWESAAKKDDTIVYSIGPSGNNLRISKDSPLKLPPEKASWIRVERFVTGIVENVGGKKKANLHITVPGEKSSIVVESTREILKGFDKVYNEVTLKISYEYHYRTHKKKNFHLEKIISPKPVFSREDRMAKLNKVAEEGRKVWADVPDHNRWLSALRGEGE